MEWEKIYKHRMQKIREKHRPEYLLYKKENLKLTRTIL